MRPPCWEVADIVRMHGEEFLDGQPGWFTYQHLKVYRAITACRTQGLGGHLDQCSQCGYRAISYSHINGLGVRVKLTALHNLPSCPAFEYDVRLPIIRLKIS
jgi:hypothetical protein